MPFAEDDRLRNPDLAQSLRLLAAEGPEPFYRGCVARRVVEAVTAAGGILQESDFGQIPVREVPSLGFRYRDFDVATLPANSGGPTLAAALSHLGAFPPVGPPTGSVEQEIRFFHWRRSRFGWRFWIASPTWAIQKVLRSPSRSAES